MQKSSIGFQQLTRRGRFSRVYKLLGQQLVLKRLQDQRTLKAVGGRIVHQTLIDLELLQFGFIVCDRLHSKGNTSNSVRVARIAIFPAQIIFSLGLSPPIIHGTSLSFMYAT